MNKAACLTARWSSVRLERSWLGGGLGFAGCLCTPLAAPFCSSFPQGCSQAPSVPHTDLTHRHVTAISTGAPVWVESLGFVVSPHTFITKKIRHGVQPHGCSRCWWLHQDAVLRELEQSWEWLSCLTPRSEMTLCVPLASDARFWSLAERRGLCTPCASRSLPTRAAGADAASVLGWGLAKHEVLGTGKRQHLPHPGQGFIVLPLYCCVYKPGAL